MDTARIREGIRKMRFSTILDRWEAGEMSQETAAEVLGMSIGSFQRWRERYEADGEAGLVDRRGFPSRRRAPQEEVERMLGLYRDKYADFTVKHFHEQLLKRHGYKLGYTVTKLCLHRAGLVRPAPKRSAHRKKRPRRPMRGMMLHQDGSRHVWVEGLPAMDLIVTMDDATSEVYSMILVEEEGTASTFQALREVVAEHGLFCALYTDRGSHYFYTSEAGGKVSTAQLTQVGRALAHLGIESPSPPIRRRRGDAPSGCSPPCRTGCPRSCGSPGSQPSRRPTPGSSLIILPSTTPASPGRRNRRVRPSSRRQGDGARDPVRRRGAHGLQRQHRGVERKAPATAGEPPAPAFRQGASQGPRISGWSLRRFPRPAPARRLRRQGSPPRPDCAQAWRRARGRQGQALSGALARVLDRPCARRQFALAGRDEETAAKPNQETAQTQPGQGRSMTNSNRAVRGFRPASIINPKTPHHALQKHDRLTRYGQPGGR